MKPSIWFVEGLSSQREILQLAKQVVGDKGQVLASHRQLRPEILSVADWGFIEPESDHQRLQIITETVAKFQVKAIVAGRNCQWFEQHRRQIEQTGTRVITGATSLATHQLADDKLRFAELMAGYQLPVVPAILIEEAGELRRQLALRPFGDAAVCIKPVTGIYGMGFWRFDDNCSPMACFSSPEQRRVSPNIYLQILEQAPLTAPMMLMPYLPGPEYSVDMLVEQGRVIAAVGRRKQDGCQYLENQGPAIDLARHCARILQADGLVNVQTRNDSRAKPVLLEINLRPSGGIGYTRHSGVNLPGLLTLRQLSLVTQSQAEAMALQAFSPATVRAISDSVNVTGLQFPAIP
ncbi:ATP-grasp domain-containing protein [Biostraticola tofi]|uniref:ATP-grasp domain-containing protein n=1 Tax=Biostraticola tofi TaxID=466109 RepID=A0A4R3YRN9_9GAMM|nr:ATP-grasp domain-containing protein [Biostraticola tofi]TCV94328.1 ATP-grasp domain-containing protein [Biostraticola tofi]